MKVGDLLYPKRDHLDLPKSLQLGIFTGQFDEHGRKLILWPVSGRIAYIEEWEEKYYEVLSETR